MKNRKREFCTSGSVRGEGGNILTYSAARKCGGVAVGGAGAAGWAHSAHWHTRPGRCELIRKLRPALRLSCRGSRRLAGASAATRGSNTAGAPETMHRIRKYAAELVAVASPMSFSPPVEIVVRPLHRPHQHRANRLRCARPRGCRVRRELARPGANATGFTTSNSRSAENGWSCSSTLHHTFRVSRCSRDPTNAASIAQYSSTCRRRRASRAA